MKTMPAGYWIEPRGEGFAWVRTDGREGVAWATRERAIEGALTYEEVDPL